MFEIIRDVLFPILSYSAADEELWNTDPYEYIRVKFGKIELTAFKLIVLKNLAYLLICFQIFSKILFRL